MKAYSSRELIRIIEVDGWELVRVKGDHYQFKHPQAWISHNPPPE